MIEANKHGWTSPLILALFVIAAVGLVGFVLLEQHQRVPMLDLSLFRNPTFAGANAVMLLVGLAMFGVFLFVTLYMQNVLRYSPTKAGAAFLPMTILIVLLAPIAGKLSDRFGSRWLMAGGMSLVSLSLLLNTRLDAASSYWDILPPLVVGGAGMGLAMTPTVAAAMGSVPMDKAGVGSAVLNSMRQVGGSLGIAILGAIVASHITAAPTDPRAQAQFLDGFHAALYVAAAIAFVGAIVAVVTVRKMVHAGDTRLPRGRMSSRLPAEERKAAVLDCACGIFSTGSYRGTTTAEIARKAGVTEPILYRHFDSKRDLYLAVLEESWRLLRELWDGVVAEEEDPKLWVLAIGTAYFEATDPRLHTANLWIQSLTEASDDPEIRKYLRKHMREVHGIRGGCDAALPGGRRGPEGTRCERRGVDLPGHRPARNSRPPRRRPGRRGLPPDLQFPSSVDDRRRRSAAGPQGPGRVAPTNDGRCGRQPSITALRRGKSQTFREARAGATRSKR